MKPPADFIESVLERTSGRPCRKAEAWLAGAIDEPLDAVERELLDGHLEHCPPCTSFAAALQRTLAVLPTMAELDETPDLVEAVAAETTRRKSLLERLWARPRIAAELAYVGALGVLLAVGLPTAPWREAPAKLLTRPVVVAGATVGDLGSGAWQATTAGIEQTGDELRHRWDALRVRFTEKLEKEVKEVKETDR